MPDYSMIIADHTGEQAQMLRENDDAQRLAWKAED